jgi:DNA-binding NtrC family response regulator
MDDRAKILIADHDPKTREFLARWLEEHGHHASSVDSERGILAQLAASRWDLLLLEFGFSGSGHAEFHLRLHEIDPSLTVLFMTPSAAHRPPLSAVGQGTYYYITKPLDQAWTMHLVDQIIAHRRAQAELERLQRVFLQSRQPEALVGTSTSMLNVAQGIKAVAATRATVLITGERGTGKELVARAIHHASPRQFRPLVVVPCGVIAAGLSPIELPRLAERASRGTVVFDEIGELNLETQANLYSALSRKSEQLRGLAMPRLKVDFRCIATSSRNLEAMVAAGEFRADLLALLGSFKIHLLPLRERPEDIPLLINHFSRRFAMEMNKTFTGVTRAAMDLLQQWHWPGNVRELANAVESAVSAASGPELQSWDFRRKFPAMSQTLADAEKTHILEVLEQCSWNQSRAARVLHIDRVTLYHKMKKYGWSREHFKSTPGAEEADPVSHTPRSGAL